MSGDSSATSEEHSHPTEARAHVEKLESHLPRDDPFASKRVSSVRAHITDYEQAETVEQERDALDRVEDEIKQLRDAIEREVEEGKQKAHELLDDLETRISNLRD